MDILDLLNKAGGDEHDDRLVINRTMRQKCPVCGCKRSLSVRDETFAKCFHCGRWWSTQDVDPQAFWVEQVLSSLAGHCYTALAQSKEGARVKEYLRERRIEDEVLHSAPIGVVPRNYDLQPINALLERTYEQVKIDPPAKPADKTKEGVAEWLKQCALAAEIKKTYDSLKFGLKTLTKCEGWLAMFYAGADGLCAVKLRDPNSKDFRMIGSGGVFWPEEEVKGYTQSWLAVMECCDEEICPSFLAFEGEFNLLQWHSALCRVDAAAGRPWMPNPSCALGGSKTWDVKTLLTLSSNPVVNADNDQPGIEAVKLAAKNAKTPIRYFTLKAAKDMDEFLLRVPTEQVIDQLLDQFPRIGWMCREYEDVRDELNDVLGARVDRINTQVGVKILWKDLQSRGKFYWHKITGEKVRAFYWFRETKELVRVGGDHIWWQTHLAKYGVLSRDTFAKQMINTVIERSTVEGKETKVYSLAHYDAKTNTCYINLGANKIAVVTEDDEPEVQYNGFDGVLFLEDALAPVKFVPNAGPAKQVLDGDTPFTRMVARSNISPNGPISVEGYRYLLAGRVLSMFFRELVPELVLMAMIGPYGCGKTEVARQIGLTLFGESFEPTLVNAVDRRNLETVLINSEFTILDNLDEGVTPEILNLLAVLVTNGSISQRKLYSDSEMVSQKLRAHTFVTAQTIPWDRGDIVSRTIRIPVEPLPEGKAVSKLVYGQQILKQRDLVFSDLIYRVRNALNFTRSLGTHHTSFRCRSFSDFVVGVSSVEQQRQVVSWFDKVTSDSHTKAQADNWIYERLCEVIGKNVHTIRQCVREGTSWCVGKRQLIDKMNSVCYDFNHHVKSQRAVHMYIQQESVMLKRELGLELRHDNTANVDRYHFHPSEEALRRCEYLFNLQESPERYLPNDVDSTPKRVN